MTKLTSLWALTGEWRLERRIAHADGREDQLEGFCRFVRSGPRLIQNESGTLTMNGQSFQASRRYIWERSGDRINVRFQNMRPFHSIPVGAEHYETIYLCPPDRYEVVYDFSGWPEWQSTWRVEGPRKDYVMTNRLRPAT